MRFPAIALAVVLSGCCLPPSKKGKADADAGSPAPTASARVYIPRPVRGESGFLYCSLTERAPIFSTEADFKEFVSAASAKNSAEIKRLEARVKSPVVGAEATVLELGLLGGWSRVRVNNSSLAGTEGYTLTECTFSAHPKAAASAP